MIKINQLNEMPERPCRSRLSFEFASSFDPYSFEKPKDGRNVLFMTPRGMEYDLALMGVIALRLRLEGRNSHFILCDNLPMCSQRDIRNNARDICDRCIKSNVDFLSFNGFDYSSIWRYLDTDDVKEAKHIASEADPGRLDDIIFDGIPLGANQDIAISRYFFRGSPEDNSDGRRVTGEFIYSAVLLEKAFYRAIEEFSPEMIIVPNGKVSWASIATALGEKHGIKVISIADLALFGKCGEGKGWMFSDEGPAVDFKLVRSWGKWKDVPLTDEENEVLDRYLVSRKRGTRYYPDPKDKIADIEKELNIEFTSPVITLFSNVVWDTSVIRKHRVFKDMFDWIEETINAADGSDYILVIRTHPAEKGVDGFVSRQKVVDEIHRRMPSLPPNVRIIPSESTISSYTLLNISEASLTYTSTLGMETVLSGKTTLTCSIPHWSGRGFSVDVASKEEYRAYLQDFSSIPVMNENQVELARRYAYMFFFRNLLPIKLFGTHSLWNVSHYNVSNVEEIMPGSNPYLDLAINSMVGEGDFTIPRHLNYFEVTRPQNLDYTPSIVRETKALLKLDQIYCQTLAANPNNPAVKKEQLELDSEFAARNGTGQKMVNSFFRSAGAAIEQGKINDAVRSVEDVLKFDPNHVRSLIELAKILHEYGMSEDAELLLQRAVRVSPNDDKAWRCMINLLKSRGDLNAVAQKVQEWMSKCPDSKQPLVQAAGLVLEFGDIRNLRELLDKICRLGGDPAATALLASFGLPIPAPDQDQSKKTGIVKSREPEPESQNTPTRPENPEISVLLCSYNRAETLTQCFAALERQTLGRDQFEIVCVNDGSTDSTRQVMLEALQKLPGVYCEHDTNKALAAARNTAIRQARGRLVLFINDDTYPEPDMLEQHIAAHRTNGGGKIAVLGYISFIADQADRMMSRALHDFNLLFPLMGTREGVEYGFDYFVTGNLSVPREAFMQEDVWFDETFRRYGCEDIEVGYRLWQAGYRVYHHPAARAVHDHLLTVRDYERREIANSANLVQFVDKHPELVPYYLGVPDLNEEILHVWQREVDQFAPQLPSLIEQLSSIEDATPAQFGSQAGEVVKLMGEGLKHISGHLKRRTILETLQELPQERKRLVKNRNGRPVMLQGV